ncbi:MAG: hypothetical protein AOA65_0418 [Candidatus Bathyarchaeota archaeon BA1]|nr:MAG: hypothetical protein AOA65_0418 [Candidatus Bathyarchaeota archaeon BA1]
MKSERRWQVNYPLQGMWTSILIIRLKLSIRMVLGWPNGDFEQMYDDGA